MDAPSWPSGRHLPDRRPHVGDDSMSKLEGILDLAPIWLEDVTRIPEAPRVLGEWSCCPEHRLERGLVLQAGKRQFADVMRPAEEMVVVGEKRLQPLLGGLLTVEGCVGKEGWGRGQIHFRCSQVEFGTRQPGRHVFRASVTRHAAERLP